MIKMEMSKGKMISYIAILGIICICAFLFAKFMVRKNINNNEVPIDTSTRLE